jgi:hypothetical protein
MDTAADLPTLLPTLARFVAHVASQMLMVVPPEAVARLRAEVDKRRRSDGSVSVRVPGVAFKLPAEIQFHELDGGGTAVDVRAADYDNAGQVMRALDPNGRLYAASLEYALFVRGEAIMMRTNNMVVGRDPVTGQPKVTMVTKPEE